jgi:hypothetical protein
MYYDEQHREWVVDTMEVEEKNDNENKEFQQLAEEHNANSSTLS